MKTTRPDDLKEEGSKLWDATVEQWGERLLAIDLPALGMACRWIDRFNDNITAVGTGIDVRLGIACDKFLLLSQRFGLTPRDRKDNGFEKVTKKAERKKTSLDSLSPEALGARGTRKAS